MPKIVLRRFLNFNAYLVLFMLIIVLTFGIFVSYFIKEYNYPFVENQLQAIDSNCHSIAEFYERKSIRNSLYLINSCTLLHLSHASKKFDNRKDFENNLISAVHSCSLNLTNELPQMRIAIYSIKNKKFLYFTDSYRRLTFDQTKIVQLKQDQSNIFDTENNSDYRDKKTISIHSKKYLIEWVIIPLERIGFEYYINTSLKDLRYVLIGFVPTKDLAELQPIKDIENMQKTIDARVRFLTWTIKTWMIAVFLVSVVIVILNIRFKEYYIEKEG